MKDSIEICDVSNIDNKIKIEIVPLEIGNNENRNDDIILNNIPLSNYYYDTLLLSLDTINLDDDKITIEKINNFKNEICLFWFYCYINRIENINDDIWKNILSYSKKIAQFINNCKNNNNNNNKIIDGFFKGIGDERFIEWKNRYKEHYMELINSINCVALAYPLKDVLRDKTNSFFSLSGASNDYIGHSTTIKYEQKLNCEYKIVNNLLEFLYGYEFIESHLDDDVKRYTYINSKLARGGIWPGKVLKHPIDFKKDYIKCNTVYAFARYYSCCEKKIVAKMHFVNKDYSNLINGITVTNKLSSYIFKILKEPCPMCRPALIGCYDIYYDNLNHILVLNNSNPNEPLIMK